MKLIARAIVAALPFAVLALPTPAQALTGPDSSVCTTRQLTASWKIDDPTKSGTQSWGTLKVYEGWCWSNAVEFRGVWSEGHRNDGGTLKVGISTQSSVSPYATYSLSRNITGTTDKSSPVLQKESPGSYWGWASTSTYGYASLYSA